MMTILAMTALLIGALLGLRFKVFILVPAIFIGSVATFGVAVTHNISFWLTLLALIMEIAALQVGYIVGTVIARVRVLKDSPRAAVVAQRPSV